VYRTDTLSCYLALGNKQNRSRERLAFYGERLGNVGDRKGFSGRKSRL
jgi:hypothetical protein